MSLCLLGILQPIINVTVTQLDVNEAHGRTIEEDAQIFNVRCFGRRAVARLHSSEAKAMCRKQGWEMAVEDAWLCENDQECKAYPEELHVGPLKCN